ncbi:dihydroorotate dehydrogenase [Thermospira aquatica]|uniref:Dihydroorotate dehydrogenase n=1 Tax=Thermospira aquatica TaxID=2828656 RepID=A0AAX3BBX9_9SPIR|nr:dihydroorotate dehydrogenase [Thermospira aquatica]URA09745.1 dihydroorotate dehydrogenase [Thermospira aquatica]
MFETKIGQIVFRNPVMTASGTFGMGDPFRDFYDYSQLGGVVLKTLTPRPRKGNPPPRLYETPAGLLNSIGLENEGFDVFEREVLEKNPFAEWKTNVIVSLAGDEEGDFVQLASRCGKLPGVSAIELNLSCPNVHAGGATFDSEQEAVYRIVSEAIEQSSLPVFVKLSPQHDLVRNARVAEKAGAAAVTISNTYLGMAIDIHRKSFVFARKFAGFSGPAVKPMALAHVYRVSREVNIPVIASGGIASGEDAAEFLLAGARLLQIGTMGFVKPTLAVEVVDFLERFFGDVAPEPLS